MITLISFSVLNLGQINCVQNFYLKYNKEHLIVPGPRISALERTLEITYANNYLKKEAPRKQALLDSVSVKKFTLSRENPFHFQKFLMKKFFQLSLNVTP